MSRFFFISGVCVVMGLSLARAQTPGVLDTAPGASGATNVAATIEAPPPAIPAGTSLIPSGGFALIRGCRVRIAQSGGILRGRRVFRRRSLRECQRSRKQYKEQGSRKNSF